MFPDKEACCKEPKLRAHSGAGIQARKAQKHREECAHLRLKATGEKNAPNIPCDVISKVWIPQTTEGRSRTLGARPSAY